MQRLSQHCEQHIKDAVATETPFLLPGKWKSTVAFLKYSTYLCLIHRVGFPLSAARQGGGGQRKRLTYCHVAKLNNHVFPGIRGGVS